MLLAAMPVTAFGTGGDAPGDLDDDATLPLRSQRPMMFQDDEVEMQDRVGALETVVDDAVDHGLPPECAKILGGTIFRTHLDVFRRALLGDRAASSRYKGRAAKPRASPMMHIPGDENCLVDLLSRWVTRPGGPVCVHASVKYTELIFAASDTFATYEVVHGVQVAAAEGGPTLDLSLIHI